MASQFCKTSTQSNKVVFYNDVFNISMEGINKNLFCLSDLL